VSSESERLDDDSALGREARDASRRSSCVCEWPICRVFLISAQKVLAVVMEVESWAVSSAMAYLFAL